MNAFLVGKIWAMEQAALSALADAPPPPTPPAATEACLPAPARVGEAADTRPYAVSDGVAIIPLVGVLTKYEDLFSWLYGGTSTQRTLAIFEAAVADEQVRAVLFYVDSPGGYIDGVATLAEAIADAAKPVWAYVSDNAHSAAYWIASQCDRIYANTTAGVGSIGVYRLLDDTSKLFEEAGVKRRIVKAGEFKGVGEDGVEITDPQLADQQREVDAVYDVFVDAVASGRGLDRDDALSVATGQSWIAGKAQELNLIDGVASIDDVLSLMTGDEVAKANVTAATQTTPTAATSAEQPKPAQSAQAATQANQPDADPVIEPTPPATPAQAEAAVADDESETDEAKAAKVRDATARAERQRLADIMEVCDDDAAFANEQFIKGADKAAAAIAYNAKLRQERQADKANAAQQQAASAVGGTPGVEAVAVAPAAEKASLNGLSPGLQKFANSIKLPGQK